MSLSFCRKLATGFIFIGCATSTTASAAPPGTSSAIDQTLPFWKRNPKLHKRILEERAVLVSVHEENVKDLKENNQIRFTLNGAGLVSKPKDFCFALSQQFEKLPSISEHFKHVSFDASKHQLTMDAEALGYQAHMLFDVQAVAGETSELRWRIVHGPFTGMQGVIGYEKSSLGKTEMSVRASFEASELPLPKALLGFALEVVIQKVAEKIRSYLESQVESI